jgi:hypothetical protein
LDRSADVPEAHFGLDNMSGSASVTSRLSHKSVEWERTRATGSAAVDLTNLVLNPQKPSAINVWQVVPCAGCTARKSAREFALARTVPLVAPADERHLRQRAGRTWFDLPTRPAPKRRGISEGREHLR